MSLLEPIRVLRERWEHLDLALRARAARALLPRRWVVSRGLRFTLPCENWITQYRWETYNTKEPETLDCIDRWMRNGDTFFDVGANIGVYSIYAALRHPRARVIAFEPESANLHLLRDNVVQNGLQERVQVHSTALGRRSGLTTLHLQDFTPGSALHTVSREALSRTREERPIIWRQGVYEMTLDEFCRETGFSPNCLKIDVDGTEADVLSGGASTLASPTLRAVVIEVSADAAERAICERRLVDAGLRSLWKDSNERRHNQVWVREEIDPQTSGGGHPA